MSTIGTSTEEVHTTNPSTGNRTSPDELTTEHVPPTVTSTQEVQTTVPST